MIDELKKILEEERIRCRIAGCEFDSDYVSGQIYIYMRRHYKFERKPNAQRLYYS